MRAKARSHLMRSHANERNKLKFLKGQEWLCEIEKKESYYTSSFASLFIFG